jgi:CHASE2 domain-containing sensor protein
MTDENTLNLGGVIHRIDRAKIRDVLARLRAADPEAGALDVVGGAFAGTGLVRFGPPAPDLAERPADLRRPEAEGG